jgi:predicted metal-dependent HD superfamily phosphohydrolase
MLTEQSTEALHRELRNRWEATLPCQQQIVADLLTRYAEPHRHYHNASHLIRVLRTIDDLSDDQDLFLVRLAAWFHDAVYAIPLVRLTAAHTPGNRDPEGELLCDADLEILAAPPEEYAAYAAAIRAEYAAVPEEVFLAGRLEILTGLIEGEIFHTPKGRAMTEAAQANLAAECAALQNRLDELVQGSTA